MRDDATGLTGILFQSLSGLSLGLNSDSGQSHTRERSEVSIPFRAVTGFELKDFSFEGWEDIKVSIPFRAVTGFERLVFLRDSADSMFQPLSGLSLGLNWEWMGTPPNYPSFQSLSGLSLGLNSRK